MATFDEIWDKIYGAGEQLNRYPFSSVVTFLHRFAPLDLDRDQTKVLEIGSGAGNNLWFAAREGFQVTGLDASADAIEFARGRFAEENLSGAFVVGDFTQLPFEDQTFDVVLERAALCQAPKPSARDAVIECARCLKPEGVMYAEIYSDRVTTRGTLIEGGIMVNTEGPYSGVGQIAFYSKSEIYELFQDFFEIVELSHTETSHLIPGPFELSAHWSIVARKLG